FGHAGLIGGLDVADPVGLSGEHGADAHRVLVVGQEVDAVEVGPALVLQVRRCPVVVFAGADGQLRADGLIGDVEGAAGVDLRRSTGTEPGGVEFEGGVGQQTRVHRRGGLLEAGGGGGEVEADASVVE